MESSSDNHIELKEEEEEDSPNEQLGRRVFINSPQERLYCSNLVRNTKYTLLTFIPANLFEQFKRVANLYFLVISLITLTPASPIPPGAVISALAFVLAANAVKEAVEDYKRYKQDKRINEKLVNVLRDGEFVKIKWMDVVVGDIVQVLKDEFIPADLLLLSSSLPNALCYISTSNLDGETTLKVRQGLNSTSDIDTPEKLMKLRGIIKCEDPHSKLKFRGSLKLSEWDKELPLNFENIIIRATKLRNTQWVHGIVLYTGHETKAVLNTTTLPSKSSRIEQFTNYMIVVLLIIEIILSIISAFVGGFWERDNGKDHWYLPTETNIPFLILQRVFTFIVLYSSLVPISLYVTLEFVRVGQSLFFKWDDNMYFAEGKVRAQCRNSNLNEELGQIQHIFCDKTGTLTCNQMELRLCSVGGKVYGSSPSESTSTSAARMPFRDESLENKLKKEKSKKSRVLREFFKVLTICHSAIPEVSDDEITYLASSPDEIALVQGARDVGVVFKKRTSESIVVDILGKEEEFQVLNVLEFTSDRRRMSIICKDSQVMYTKGADSTILERISKDQKVESTTSAHLNEFASIGLRTLCIAKKEIDPVFYSSWNKKWHKASISLTQREQKLEELAEEIEKELTLLGATGIEDKLQDGVPSTIANLLLAGLKIWVLTGDKQETAINVGRSSKLIQDGQQILVLDSQSQQECHDQIKEHINKIQSSTSHVLVISGKTMSLALSESVVRDFLALSNKVTSVICCRATPLQKSLVVTAVRKHHKVITLAIGDGANDVSMIQQAHVGVGIKGKEGIQAALASDYAIGQFKYLERLLLVHGRWSYWRISLLVFYIFYKNIMISVLQFWWSLHTGFSGQTFYDSIAGVGFNVVFTALPIIVVAVLDKDLPDKALLQFPELYRECQNDLYFNAKLFIKWLLVSLINCTLCFFIPMEVFKDIVLHNGQQTDLWLFSTAAYTGVILVANLKLGLEVKTWSKIFHFFLWGSVLLWFVFAMVYCSIYIPPWTSHMEFSTGNFYLVVIIVIAICTLPDITWKYVEQNYFPKPHHIVEEIVKCGKDQHEIKLIDTSHHGDSKIERRVDEEHQEM